MVSTAPRYFFCSVDTGPPSFVAVLSVFLFLFFIFIERASQAALIGHFVETERHPAFHSGLAEFLIVSFVFFFSNRYLEKKRTGIDGKNRSSPKRKQSNGSSLAESFYPPVAIGTFFFN